MRRLGIALFAVGIFLVATAGLVKWYVAPNLEKAPIDAKETVLQLTGSGTKADSTLTLQPITLKGTRTVYVRKAVSSKTVAVYDSYVVVDNASTGANTTKVGQRVALDRHTGQAVETWLDSYNDQPSDAKGLVLKFPFHTERKNYPFFDGQLNNTYTARFVTAETLNGVQVYRFVQDVPESQTKYNLYDSPSNLADIFYSNSRTLWVEPTTGIIVKGQEHQLLWLATTDGTRGPQVADLTLGYDDPTVAQQAKEAKDGKAKLDLVGMWLPLVGLILGIVLIVLGVVLAGRARSSRPNPGPDNPGHRDLDDWPGGPLTDVLPKHASQ